MDEQKIASAAAICSVLGIALLFAFSETPQAASVASALVAQENSLLFVSGTAQNVTSDKFLLCDGVCISARKGGIVSGELVHEGGHARVLGRVQEYRGNRYLQAEKIEVG